MQQQIAGDRTRVLLLAVHAQGERLNTTTHRIAFVRRKHATQTILREVDTFDKHVVLDHHKNGVDFGMAGQILGSGMDDDVGTLVERQLQIRGNECVVDNGNRTIAMSDFSNLRHIVDLQQRIGKNFEIHGLRRTTMRGSLGGVPGNSGIKRFVVGGFTAPVLLSLTGSPWTN